MGQTKADVDAARASTSDPQWAEVSDAGPPVVSADAHVTSPLVVSLVVLGALLGVGALFLWGSTTVDSPAPPIEAAPAPSSRVDVPTTAPPPELEVVEPMPEPPQLTPAPAEWLTGQVVAFIDDSKTFHLYDLSSGESRVGKQWATFPWPPLRDDIRILGGRNVSFAIDPTSPEDSGRISTTVHTVRLAIDDDIFGFFSRSDEGVEFFAGSQWGPANRGLIDASARSDVFVVPGRAIVVAEPNATGQIIGFDGVEEVPSRLGRIVAASQTGLLGVHCDDFGRCVGRLADWDGASERIVPAELAANETVSISPDGRFILFGSATSWGIWDVDTGTFREGDARVSPNRSVAWAAEGSLVWWLQDGVVVAVDARDDLEAFAAPIRDIDPLITVADDSSLALVSLRSEG